ncbi:MAG: dihydropteroate synthase [Thermodesulfobacteriota bacterium]
MTEKTCDPKKDAAWTVRGGRVLGPAPFLVMGIVNVTPDSFSDGGVNLNPSHALDSASRLIAQGAAIVDVGGESTRPGAAPVSEAEELGRVIPVLEAVGREHPGAALSVDTYKARVAAGALEAGAVIVNDVSACGSFEPELLDVVAQYKPGYVLMHSQGRPGDMQSDPRYGSVLAEVARFFEIGMARLVNSGLPEDRIVLDPGIGFGKTLEHNLALLRGLPLFSSFGRPIMMGLSNKSLFGKLLGLDVGNRGAATQVATALAYERGARIHRVHDAAGAVAALTLAEALCG